MIKSLYSKKGQAVAQARSIMDTATTENRSMTAEEEQRFDAFMAETESLNKQIERVQALEAHEAPPASRGRVVTGEPRSADPDVLRAWLLLGSDMRPTDEQVRAVTKAANVNGKTFSFSLRSDPLRPGEDFQTWQNRAQSIGTASAGGYTVAQGFSGEVERALLAFGGVRSVARVMRTENGADIPWPLSNDTGNESGIIGENGEIPSAHDIAFTNKTLKAFKYSTDIIKVSTELLQDSAVNITEIVGGMLGERDARGKNRHATIGNGTTQPEGCVTAATLGVTAAGPTAITSDELLDLIHSVDPAYRSNATLMFHDTTLKEIKKLKGDDGRPLWQAGLSAADPDTINGYKYVINQHMAPMAASAKSILFGDFSKQILRDAGPLTLVRLDERYAEFGQVAFICLSRFDSRVLDAGTHPIKYLANDAS